MNIFIDIGVAWLVVSAVIFLLDFAGGRGAPSPFVCFMWPVYSGAVVALFCLLALSHHHAPSRRKILLAALAALLVAAPAATAAQAPVKQDPPVAGAEAGLSIQECLAILVGLNALDGHRVILNAGKPSESAETVGYKFSGKLRDAISHNIFVLGQVQQEAQAANRRAQQEIGGGEAIKPGSKENVLFDQRMTEYTARPCKVELDRIRDSDLKLDDNDIPGSILALLWKIRDR